MKRIRLRIFTTLLAVIWLISDYSVFAGGKSYSSGGGRSYSSHSSSSSSSSSRSSGSSSRSYSGGASKSTSSSSSGSSRSSAPSKSFSSGNRSYSSGSSGSESDRHGYSSGKSYSSGSATKYTSTPSSPSSSKAPQPSAPKSSDSSFSFDTAAARARKEESSKADFSRFKDSKAPPPIPASQSGSPNNAAGGNVGRTSRDDYSRRTVYVPDVTVIRTRPARIYNVYNSYSYRPWVSYQDPYSSLFWWWLLDRSLDDRAYWAYHHRYDMDPGRYQALVANNQELEARVQQLEAQQIPRDSNYTPTGLDRDLMYSDHYVAQAYSNRPTRSGSIAFYVFGVPLAAASIGVLIWLIWFKRWQTAT